MLKTDLHRVVRVQCSKMIFCGISNKIGGISKERFAAQLTLKFKAFVDNQPAPVFECVDRKTELKKVIEYVTYYNRTGFKILSKFVVFFAAQSQGTGKTFFGENLPLFVRKDLNSTDSVIKDFCKTDKKKLGHFEAISKTRSIVVKCDQLDLDAKSFDEAVTANIVEQLFTAEMLSMVRELNLHFCDVCDELLKVNGALVVVLDDLPDIWLGEVSFPWLQTPANATQTKKTSATMGLIKVMLEPVLHKPGLVVYMTGRSPELTYKMLQTMKSSPLVAVPILFSAFKHSDINEMLLGPLNGNKAVILGDLLGLRNRAEISELTSFLFVHSAGVGRVVECAIMTLLRMELLKPPFRGANQSIYDVLGNREVSLQLYRAIREGTPHGIMPNWSLQTEGWDKDLVHFAVIEVLNHTTGGKEIRIDQKFRVAQDVRVTVVDLLSVVGVPFFLNDGQLTVHLGAWMVHSLLYDEDVNWTHEETAQQLMAGIGEVFKVAGKDGAIAIAKTAGAIVGTAVGNLLVSGAEAL